MSLPKSIPTRLVDGFSFLSEINYAEYRKRLPRFIGEEGYEKPTPENVVTRIPRVIGFLEEMSTAQEYLTSSITNSLAVTGPEGVGKSALLLGLLNKKALGDTAPKLLQNKDFIFDLVAFSKLSPQEQTAQFDKAMEYMAPPPKPNTVPKNSMVIIDRIDDFVANCGPDRARRLMGSLINTLENMGMSAFVTMQTQSYDAVKATSTLFTGVFKELPIGERSRAETKNILRQMVPRFERNHKVVIGDDAITEAMRLDEFFDGRLPGLNPNRMIEFMDQLGSSVNNAKYGKPPELMQQELEHVELLAEEEEIQKSVRPSTKRTRSRARKN